MNLDLDPEDILESLQNDSDREHINSILPTVESWVTSNNKDFFFSLRCVDTIPSGLYSKTFNHNNGFFYGFFFN